MDEEQIDRFRSAMERKKQRSKADSESHRPAAEGEPPLADEQPSLVEPGRPQDTRDPRAKGAGHRKKTADKWNQ